MTLLEYNYLLKFIASLVLITVLLYSLYYYVSRYTSFQIKSGKKMINILDIKYLSKNKGLVLVKIKDRTILLSFDEKGLRKIKEWKDEETVSPDS